MILPTMVSNFLVEIISLISHVLIKLMITYCEVGNLELYIMVIVLHPCFLIHVPDNIDKLGKGIWMSILKLYLNQE